MCRWVRRDFLWSFFEEGGGRKKVEREPGFMRRGEGGQNYQLRRLIVKRRSGAGEGGGTILRR